MCKSLAFVNAGVEESSIRNLSRELDSRVLVAPAPPPPGRRHSLMWPKRVFAAQQGMVSRVLRLKQVIQIYTISLFSFLNRVSFWTGSREQGANPVS